MKRLSDTAIAIINELHAERLDYKSEYLPLIDAANKLAAYENIGWEPEAVEAMKTAMMGKSIAEIKEFDGIPIGHLRDLVQAEKDGRLVVLPFVAMVEQSLQDGKMKPQRDQCLNGRYAVVYSDKKKWAAPLIDICGYPYNREQAEARRAELTREEAEAALEAQKGESYETDSV